MQKRRSNRYCSIVQTDPLRWLLQFSNLCSQSTSALEISYDPCLSDCHMTCHWLCKDKVTISCEVSPPPAHTTIDDYDAYACDGNGDYDFDNGIAAEHMEPKSEGEDLRTPTTFRSSSQGCFVSSFLTLRAFSNWLSKFSSIRGPVQSR